MQKEFEKLTKRQLDIIQYLQKKVNATSMDLGNAFKVSSRTIKSDIKQINAVFSNALIISEKSIGYHLSSFVDIPFFEQINTLDRCFLILKKLLNENELDFYELADSLYISETTLNRDILEINKIIHSRNREICVERVNNKVFINGSEKNRRQVSVYFMLHELDDYNLDLSNYEDFFDEFSLQKLRDYVIKFNKENHVVMKDLETISFVMHVAIMLDRILKGNEVLLPNGLSTDEDSYILAKKFINGLQDIVRITLSQNEYVYLSTLILGKTSSVHGKEAEDIKEFVMKMLNDINEQYDVDLMHDDEFIHNLQLHLLGLINRLSNDTYLNNPLMEDIKRQFPVIYDVSVFMAMKIQEKFCVKVQESEIGYITLHLMSAVNRMKTFVSRNIVVISPIGESVNGYIRSKIQSISEMNIHVQAILSIFDVQQIDIHCPDLIVSMVPIPQNVKYPIYVCENLLNDMDLENITDLLSTKDENNWEKFFSEDLFFRNQKFHTKEEVIRYLCHALEDKGYIDENYVHLVLQREEIAPTSYGGLFAIPHPIKKNATENKISICILDKPILWNNNKVQLIFLFALNSRRDETFEEVFKQLVSLLDDIDKVKRLIRCKSLTEFLGIFQY